MAKDSLIPKATLRILVEESGLTHGQIALRAGCDRSTISRIVQGGRRAAPELALKVARTLRVSVDVVFVRPTVDE